MGNRENTLIIGRRHLLFFILFYFFNIFFIYVHPKQRAWGEREQKLCLLNYKPAVGTAAIKDLQRNLLQQFRLLEADTSRIRKPCLWSFLHGFWLMTFNPWDNIKKTKKKKPDIWSFGNEHRRRLNLNYRCLASTGLQLLTKPLQTKILEWICPIS